MEDLIQYRQWAFTEISIEAKRYFNEGDLNFGDLLIDGTGNKQGSISVANGKQKPELSD